MATPFIDIDKLTVIYEKGKSSEMVALKDINLEIYPEEYVIFFGPSGCGKSTLLYTIAGLEPAESGSIVINGRDLAKISARESVEYHRQEMGMVFQAFYLISSLSVIDNVMLPQMFRNESPAERRQRALEVLRRFDIEELANRLPNELSGGQQQRVAICRAVINNPPLVLADEPVGNLDSKSSEKVMDLLLELNTRDKKTIILVTHDPRYLHYAHRIFYIKDGVVVREVANTERGQMREEKVQPFSAQALAEFARFYPHLEESALKAKFLAHYLLKIEDENVQEILERLIRQRCAGKITTQKFIEDANTSAAAGGVGLYRQTAEHLANELEIVIHESGYLHSHFETFPKDYETLQLGIDRVRTTLLTVYSGTLNDEEGQRLNTFIKARLEGSVDHKQFKDLLHKSWGEGGLGLHFPSAEAVSKRMELILVDYPKTESAPTVTYSADGTPNEVMEHEGKVSPALPKIVQEVFSK